MTNYERIKQMSVEEMARLMDVNCIMTDKACMEMSNNGAIICDENCDCVSCFKKWLESEVKE